MLHIQKYLLVTVTPHNNGPTRTVRIKRKMLSKMIRYCGVRLYFLVNNFRKNVTVKLLVLERKSFLMGMNHLAS